MLVVVVVVVGVLLLSEPETAALDSSNGMTDTVPTQREDQMNFKKSFNIGHLIDLDQ